MPHDLTKKHLDYHDAGCVTVAMDVDYPVGSSTGWHAHPRAQLLHAIEGVMTVRSGQGGMSRAAQQSLVARSRNGIRGAYVGCGQDPHSFR